MPTKKYANRAERKKAQRLRRKQRVQNQQQPTSVQGRKISTIRAKNEVRLNLAEGDRANIMVLAPLNANAIQAMPLAVISNGLIMGVENTFAKPISWAYLAFLQDLISILSAQVTPLSARIAYLNSILASFRPKTIPFKTGTISFSWTGVDAIASAPIVNVRNYKYYLYVPDGGTNPGGYSTQSPPPAYPTLSEAISVLSNLFSQVANDSVPHLIYKPDAEFTAAYKKDGSAFAAVSPYYGSGNEPTSSGAFSSGELEVPFKSIVLMGATAYSPSDGRVARKFNLTSGDTTSALGLAFLPGMTSTVYNTKYPIQYCFLDLDEVVLWLQQWFVTMVQKTFTTTVGTNTDLNLAMAPFPQSGQQFRIAVRQAVLGFFGYSQSMTQFLTYSQNPNGFEPFRVSTNSYGRNRFQMRMPEVLVENLRMLLPKFFDVNTKFKNEKNQLIVVPVWGIYKAVEDQPYNLSSLLWNDVLQTLVVQPLFSGAITNDPNPIDGTDTSGNCCDLNSNLIEALIQEWNDRVDLLCQTSVPTAYLGGNSDASLLLHTRFVKYVEIDVKLSKISKLRQRYIPTDCVVKKKLERTNSAAKQKEKVSEEEYYIPSGATLFRQVTTQVSALPAITEDYKLLYNYVILPTIVIEDDTPPTSKQVRVGTVQSHVLDFQVPDNPYDSTRGNKLLELGRMCAPGTANAEQDEIITVIKRMAESAQGGFVGDLLGALAREIPI